MAPVSNIRSCNHRRPEAEYGLPLKKRPMSQSNAIAPSGRKAILKMLEGLRSRDPFQREQSREQLFLSGHEVVIPLIRQLKSPSDRMRWEVAKTLGCIGGADAAAALAEALDDENHDVRWVAAEALIRHDERGLEQTLITLLTKANSIWVRESAHHVLSHFANQKSGRYLRPLLRLFGGFEPAVTIPPAALATLRELRQRISGELPPQCHLVITGSSTSATL